MTRPLATALILALMAAGFVFAPVLPGGLGLHEAIWGRLASLVAAGWPLVALAAISLPEAVRAWVALLVMLTIAAAMSIQVVTPQHATAAEALIAARLYAVTYVTLQVVLVLAWVGCCVDALADWVERRYSSGALLPVLAPVIGVMLCALGTWMAFDAHFLAPDPRVVSPWAVPAAPRKLAQVGAPAMLRQEVAMLAVACLPLACVLARMATRDWVTRTNE